MERTESLSRQQAIVHSFASCHSLAQYVRRTVLPGQSPLELIGDPLDIKMFAITQWSLHDPATSHFANHHLVRSSHRLLLITQCVYF